MYSEHTYTDTHTIAKMQSYRIIHSKFNYFSAIAADIQSAKFWFCQSMGL